MLTAAPVDSQDDFARGVIDVSDDFHDKGAQQSLPCAHTDTWRIPGGIQISRKPGKVGRRSGFLGRLHCLQSRLARLDTAKRCFPTLLELRRDQAILGITRGVTPFGKGGFVPSLLQFQLHDTLLLNRDGPESASSR